MKTLSTTSDMLLSSTAVLNSFRRATCTLQLTDRAKERKTAVAIFLETKSDLTKAIWRVFRLMSDMASSLNTTPSGSKGATPSSSSLNRLSTASNEGKAEGSKLRNANPSQYVKLNVGGSLHYTTIGTLTKVGDFDHGCVLEEGRKKYISREDLSKFDFKLQCVINSNTYIQLICGTYSYSRYF